MQIKPANNTMLCPLAGYTDAPFRAMCAQYGAAITVTEMVSVKALASGNRITTELLYTQKEPCIRAVQLFGSDLAAYEQVMSRNLFGDFDVIDINMGCPVPKVFNNGDGSALMTNPELAGQIVRLVKQGGKTVSVKFRSGITDDSLCVPLAKQLEKNGADYLTVHARTRKQMYAGNADWTVIKRVTEAVDIPVYGNGDVQTRQDYLAMLEQTGCYGVAVGRGALGKPYLFAQLLDKPYQFDVYQAICRHIQGMRAYLPDNVVLNEIKKHVSCYLKGMRNVKKVVDAAQQDKSLDDLTHRLAEFLLISI